MKLGFYGGVGEVTGSRHLLETEDAKVLLDCGLFQGHRRQAMERNRTCPFDAASVSDLLLSHAHVDHCGSIPLLVKNGFRGAIRCTPATREIVEVMLLDSAHLQTSDAAFFNKLHERAGDAERIEPLYTEDDVRACLPLFQVHPVGEWIELAPRTRFRFHNAGHVLGSAMIEVEARASAGLRRLLFTGDLGRRKALLMDPPRAPRNADYLLVECTYGGRLHESVDDVEAILRAVVARAVEEKGKILIPSFALERTQELVFVLEKLIRHGQIPKIPIYVDSPMAVSITEIFNRHLEAFSFSPEFKAYVAKEGNPFDFKAVRYIRDVADSQKLNDEPGPMIILSASGMCEGGRILHHLRNNLDKPSTRVLIVGHQAEGTLGRRLQEGVKKVRIFGLEQRVRAHVQTLHSFSAHADRDDLLWFVKAAEPRPRTVFLVHGDPLDRAALAELLKSEGVDRVVQPEYGQSFPLE